MKMRTAILPEAAPVPLKLVIVGWLAFSLVGFFDATYLTVKHYRGAPPGCSLLRGCEVVTTSQYAVIGGIPIALLGALYYLSILLLTAAYLDTRQRCFLKIAGHVTISGFLVSLFLVYLQVFVLHALCLYCLLSALTSTALFLLGAYGDRMG